MNKNLKIITSKAIKFTPDGLEIISTYDELAFCPIDEISDIKLNIHFYFSKFKNYKFYIYGKKDDVILVSYKRCHPIFLLNKNKIYPTVSHYHNLIKKVNRDINNY